MAVLAARSLGALALIVGSAALLGVASAAPAGRIATDQQCALPHHGAKKLPAACNHGPIQHLRQYPDVSLASTTERARARQLLAELVSASRAGNWRDLRAVARAGYDTRTATRKAGDRSVRYFHAERGQEPRRGSLLNPTRPKALIYANAPARPLVLVGAMWSTQDGERGPTPGGPITRWHTHVVCLAEGSRRGTKPPSGGKCPPDARLVQGKREMFHMWFTGDLRSAFAISAPEPELCAAGLLPSGYCRRVKGRAATYRARTPPARGRDRRRCYERRSSSRYARA